MTTRGKQPKCEKCNHPISFHSGGASFCRALGCICEGWVGEINKSTDIKVIMPEDKS